MRAGLSGAIYITRITAYCLLSNMHKTRAQAQDWNHTCTLLRTESKRAHTKTPEYSPLKISRIKQMRGRTVDSKSYIIVLIKTLLSGTISSNGLIADWIGFCTLYDILPMKSMTRSLFCTGVDSKPCRVSLSSPCGYPTRCRKR